MYSELPADIRSRHPFHMYDEIRAQPEAVAAALQAGQGARDVVKALGGARRVFLVGSGTSLHAAQYGAWALTLFTRGRIEAQAIEAYEFVTYLPGLRPDDLVLAISHSGGSTMTARALERGRRSGAETVAIVGFPESRVASQATHMLPTGYAREASWAHTASYTATCTLLAALANAVADPAEHLDLSPLPEVMTDVLGLEELAHRLAASVVTAEGNGVQPRPLLIGGGPNVVTAREGALKLLETCYLPATAWELEFALHGPLASVDAAAVPLVIAPTGRSTERAAGLVRALHALGHEPAVLTDEGAADSFASAHRLLLPEIPEALSPIAAVVPLQLFAYYLAVGKGLNPDLIHRDDERYRQARGAYE